MKINPTDLDHRSSHQLQCSTIVPRPIAFISTIGEDGIFNLTPFGTFAGITVEPPIVCFSVVSRRDGQKKGYP